MNVWSTNWGPVWLTNAVARDSEYVMKFVFSQSSTQIQGFVNGTSIGLTNCPGLLAGSTDGVAIAGIRGTTKFHDGSVTNEGANSFGGWFSEVLLFKSATDIADYQKMWSSVMTGAGQSGGSGSGTGTGTGNGSNGGTGGNGSSPSNAPPSTNGVSNVPEASPPVGYMYITFSWPSNGILKEAFIGLNDDDDNTNGVSDMLETNMVANEDDLVPVTITLYQDQQSVFTEGTLTFNWGNNVKMYNDQLKAAPINGWSTNWDLHSAEFYSVFSPNDASSSYSATFYVEGTNVSLNCGDVTFSSSYSYGSTGANGSSSGTVVRVKKIFVSNGDAADNYPANDSAVTGYLMSTGATLVGGTWTYYDETTNMTVFETQIIHDQASFKAALQTTNAYVAFHGHSNHGLGLAWTNTLTSVSDFMNIGDPYTGVSWPYIVVHQANLVISESDLSQSPTNYRTCYLGIERLTNCAGNFATSNIPYVGTGPPTNVFDTVYGSGSSRFHYYKSDTNTDPRIVLKGRYPGCDDLPTLRYKWLCMDNCYSGLYYSDSCSHGVLFYSMDLIASNSDSMKRFVEAVINGWTRDQLVNELNTMAGKNIYEYGNY